MSFDTAISRLTEYKDNHLKALTNEEPCDWFLHDIEDINSTFNLEEENQTWKSEWLKPAGDQVKLITTGARLNWLARCLRDLRSQYFSNASGDNETDTTRNFTECVRHETEHLSFYKYILNKFKKLTED